MSDLGLQVLHRDADFLVVCKPAGLPTTSTDGGDCLAERVWALDPQAPRLHPSSRLDMDVTGVVTFARSRATTLALQEARAEGRYMRCYVALAQGSPANGEGTVEAAIGVSTRDGRLRQVVPSGERDAQAAVTRYRVQAKAGSVGLLWLYPETGRTHQLRVHMAHVGCPLLGDRRYGGLSRIVLPSGRVVRAARTMLHCIEVQVPRLAEGGNLRFSAPIPRDFLKAWQALGGAQDSLEGLVPAAPTA